MLRYTFTGHRKDVIWRREQKSVRNKYQCPAALHHFGDDGPLVSILLYVAEDTPASPWTTSNIDDVSTIEVLRRTAENSVENPFPMDSSQSSPLCV